VIHRARLLFVVALLASVVVVGAEFPFGQLLHERQVIAARASELSHLQTENRSLAADVASLHQPATVGRIAHGEYGLVQQGQSSVVVLPSPGDGGGTDPLSGSRIPSSDEVPSDALVAGPQTAGVGSGKAEGFFSKLLDRLEFWKAVS